MSDLYFNQAPSINLDAPSAIWLEDWALIRVTGADSKSYLQGQLTCDVVSLEKGEMTFGAHCDAKGKVWSLFRLFHIDGGYALLLPRDGCEKALLEVKKYSVFSKVEIELVDDAILGLVTNNDENSLQELQANAEALSLQSAPIDGNRSILFGSKTDLVTYLDQQSLAISEPTLWHYLDVTAGIPRVDSRNQNQHIPQAFNLQAIGGISFEKGCYTGQETVARAKYRGTNKRALFVVTGQLAKGSVDSLSLERAVGDNWRNAGAVIECVVVDETAYATLILANDTEQGAQLRVAGTDTLWTIDSLPYSIDE